MFVVLPEIFSLALLYLLVLIAGITLPGCFHETCVDNLSLGEDQALTGHVGGELFEQFVVSPCLGERLAVLPHGLPSGTSLAVWIPRKSRKLKRSSI